MSNAVDSLQNRIFVNDESNSNSNNDSDVNESQLSFESEESADGNHKAVNIAQIGMYICGDT